MDRDQAFDIVEQLIKELREFQTATLNSEDEAVLEASFTRYNKTLNRVINLMVGDGDDDDDDPQHT